jgi:translation initiation factor IF-2
LAVRIYALAKELNLDSKDLVDICTKAGIPGKGSALASLADDEVEKVKSYLSGGGKEAKPPAPKPVGKPPEIPSTSSRSPAKQVAAPPEKPTAPAAPAVVRREDYIAPGGGGGGKMPVLDTKTKTKSKKPLAAEDKKSAAAAKAPRPNPGIHLAPMPAAEQPKPQAKPDEPAPQKPDLKLPADAIRASKGGARPLADLMRGHEKRAEAERETARRGKKPATPAAAETDTRTTAKGKRGKGGKDGKDGKDDGVMLGGREQRQLSRRRVTSRGDEERRPRRPRKIRRTGTNTAAPRKENVVLSLPCTLRSFSEATGVTTAELQGILLREGTMATLNSQLDPEMAEFIAAELELEIEFKHQVSLEDQLLTAIREAEEDPDLLQSRPPIITFLGHVDHGKTSLLDRILGIDVAAGESGGITQHIRAYEVVKSDKKIAFVDTPGHEAFTEMRARGANVTDIAVLVVAADDGVMPQTEEAISHARAADVPIVVALNKVDLPGVDLNRAMQGLSANELLPSEWGGDVEVIKTSAMTGEGIEDLLDTLLTVAELHDLKANPDRAAYGTCLEAHQEAGRGVVAKVIVQTGTLNVGDVVVCGQAHGRVKAMYDTLHPNKKVAEAGPSVPVNVTGLDVAPEAGEHFYVLQEVAQAREIAKRRANQSRSDSLGDSRPHVTLENLFDRLGDGNEPAILNIIVRADVRGSIEAIHNELAKLEHDEVRVRVLQATVGGVTEADVHLADASDAIIIGFNVVPEEGARQLADRRGVQIRRYEVIYKVTDDIRAALEGMLKPEEREVELGRALVQQTFVTSRIGTIAGCRVLAGTIERNCRLRVIRNNTIIGDYAMASLRRIKDDVKEVREGMECGIRLDGFNDLKEADMLEGYKIEEVERKLDS